MHDKDVSNSSDGIDSRRVSVGVPIASRKGKCRFRSPTRWCPRLTSPDGWLTRCNSATRIPAGGRCDHYRECNIHLSRDCGIDGISRSTSETRVDTYAQTNQSRRQECNHPAPNAGSVLRYRTVHRRRKDPPPACEPAETRKCPGNQQRAKGRG